MLKCQNFEKMMTSELLINHGLESEVCEEELNRRLKSIGFTNEQIEKFIFQVIRRVTFDDYEAIDAWGNPERFLI